MIDWRIRDRSPRSGRREKKADDKGQLSTAHAIANDYAKLMGWLIEKREVTTKQAPADPCFDDLTDLEKEQWELICKPIIAKLYRHVSAD
jgi:hypothetical protein